MRSAALHLLLFMTTLSLSQTSQAAVYTWSASATSRALFDAANWLPAGASKRDLLTGDLSIPQELGSPLDLGDQSVRKTSGSLNLGGNALRLLPGQDLQIEANADFVGCQLLSVEGGSFSRSGGAVTCASLFGGFLNCWITCFFFSISVQPCPRAQLVNRGSVGWFPLSCRVVVARLFLIGLRLQIR